MLVARPRRVGSAAAALLIALALSTGARAQLSDGPNSPGATFNDASFGTAAWTNPGNAQASDDQHAVAAPGGGFTQYLHANNFGLQVPPAAVVDGIEVAIEKRSVGGTVQDARVRIVKGGVIGATDRSDANPWSTTDTSVVYGGPSDLWGEAWTAADVNANGFGVVISATDNVDTAAIDHITMTVHYSLCSQPPRVGCRTADKAVLAVKDQADDAKDRMVWRLARGEPTSQADFANPTTNAVYAACVYENGTPTSQTIVPPSGTLWKPISTIGFKYRDRDLTQAGILTVVLRGSTESKTRIVLRGKGAGLSEPMPPLALPVVVQLVNSETAVCWEATYDTPNVKKNIAGSFRAKISN